MPITPPTLDVRDQVDALLARPKKLAGRGHWSDDHRAGESRMILPLSVGGQVIDMDLQIKSFVNASPEEFTIMLTYGYCVFRLCYGPDVGHINTSFHSSGRLPLGPIVGPHYHAWADNRHLGTPTGLPKRLRFGNLLPSDVRGFPDVFRWFCDQTGIHISDADIPVLPPPSLLI